MLLGSNIDPENNLRSALDHLDNVVRKSRIWKTKAFGSNGPDFLNMAVELQTNLNRNDFKKEIINDIEKKLERVRTKDKYAPRTIDIDIMIVNDAVIDNDIWQKAFASIPVSELRPNILGPNNQKLALIAEKLKSSANAELFSSI